MIDSIDACRVCHCPELQGFLDLGAQPLANALPEAQAGADPAYPLRLSWCPRCSLVQLDHTVAPEVLFSEYIWVTSTSSGARAYAERFCERLLARAGDRGRERYVLEIASNDGTFLRPFQKRGMDVLGIDPATNIADVANRSGVPTRAAFFGPGEAKALLAERGAPGILFARNVLPHVADLHGFVEGLRLLMADGALLAVEVHYAGRILEELHYDSVYHEHLCYYSLRSLAALLGAHGIHVHDLAESAISGGSVVLFGSLEDRPKTEVLRRAETEEAARGVNALASWQDFAAGADQHRDRFRSLLSDAHERGETVCGWGASARSATLLNFCGVGADWITSIADRNSRKCGRCSPGTRIPIRAPSEVMALEPDCMVILAWNFLEEILTELRTVYGFAGWVVVPFPHPPRAGTLTEMLGD